MSSMLLTRTFNEEKCSMVIGMQESKIALYAALMQRGQITIRAGKFIAVVFAVIFNHKHYDKLSEGRCTKAS